MIKTLIHRLLAKTPWELQRRMPVGDLEVAPLIMSTLLGQQDSVTVVQVGACDGGIGDPIHQHMQNARVSALLVEPMEAAFEVLTQKYAGSANVSLERAAVSMRSGIASMYRIRRDLPHLPQKYIEYLQLSSFDKNHIIKHGFKEEEIEEVTVPAFTLDDLLKKHGKELVDFLIVDTEGFDGAVVQMALAMKVVPRHIAFEHLHLPKEDRVSIYRKLSEAGFRWVNDHMNTCAIRF